MARSQTWTRNVSKKVKNAFAQESPRGGKVVDDGGLERLKRRAEDLGLIIHAGPRPGRGKKSGRK